MSRLDTTGPRPDTPVALSVLPAPLTPFTGAPGTASVGEVLRATTVTWRG